MFSPLEESIIGKAKEKGLIDIHITDIRNFAKDKHKTADDTPYGGGPGMVMKANLIFEAVEHVKAKHPTSNFQHPNKSQSTIPNIQTKQVSKPKPISNIKVIYLSPAGKTLTHDIAKKLADYEHLILICGHYEGVDQRIIDKLVDEEISIGDYVLTGGELPAMVLIDAISRFVPGVLGHEESSMQDSFFHGLLEYPQYTKPDDYSGLNIPEILKSGNHKNIAQWRRRESMKTTFFRRPDLLAKTELDEKDMKTLESIFIGDKA